MNLRDTLKALAAIVAAIKAAGKQKSRMAKILVIVAAACTIAAGLFFGNQQQSNNGVTPGPALEKQSQPLDRLRDRLRREPREQRTDAAEPTTLLPMGRAAIEAEHAPVPGCRLDPLNHSGVCERGWNCPDHPGGQISLASQQKRRPGGDAYVALPETRRRRPALLASLKSARAGLAARRSSLRERVSENTRRGPQRSQAIADTPN